jgi:hypothetical protein
MGAATDSVRIAIRSRYGRAARFLASLSVPMPNECLKVHIFDLPGPARIYAWLSTSTGTVVVVPHGDEVTSPKAAVAFADDEANP